MDETYIKVRGRWTHLYRAIDSVGDTVEFQFSEHRDLPAAKPFFQIALDRHGRPDRAVIDGSKTNQEAIISSVASHLSPTSALARCRPVTIRKNKYLNNRIEQDRRRIKSLETATTILSGIELDQMMRKRQARYAFHPNPSLADQFAFLAA